MCALLGPGPACICGVARADVNSDHNKVNWAWRLVSAARQQPPDHGWCVLVSITINTRYGYSAQHRRTSFQHKTWFSRYWKLEKANGYLQDEI